MKYTTRYQVEFHLEKVTEFLTKFEIFPDKVESRFVESTLWNIYVRSVSYTHLTLPTILLV